MPCGRQPSRTAQAFVERFYFLGEDAGDGPRPCGRRGDTVDGGSPLPKTVERATGFAPARIWLAGCGPAPGVGPSMRWVLVHMIGAGRHAGTPIP
ncbi:Mini-circle protein OS=Streptomyces antimycoticus OX=68175 GN=SSPO_011540 PE=4 SV=1 [Streptomyces antimycoticus]